MTIHNPNRRHVLIGASAAIMLAGAAQPALAHRLARTETDVRFKGDGSVTIIHAYHVQDVQDALYTAGIIDRPDISGLRARAKLALYTAEHFAIWVNETPIELDLIGAEVEGGTVYVYQEATEAYPGALRIKAAMLRDLVHDQRNSVNVDLAGKITTLEFRGDDSLKTLE